MTQEHYSFMARTIACWAVFMAVPLGGCLDAWPTNGEVAIRSTHILDVQVHVTVSPAADEPSIPGGGEHCPWLEHQSNGWNMYLKQGVAVPDAVLHMQWDRTELEKAGIASFGDTSNARLEPGTAVKAKGVAMASPPLFNASFDGSRFLIDGQVLQGSLERSFRYDLVDANGARHSFMERMTFRDRGVVPVGVAAMGLCM